MDIWSDILNRSPLYGLTIKLAKPWTPEIFIECYCVANKKPIRREKTNPQTATVFSLWFWFFARLSWSRLFKSCIAKTLLCWSQSTFIHWNFSGVHASFLSLTLIGMTLWSPYSFSINGVRLWFKAPWNAVVPAINKVLIQLQLKAKFWWNFN